MTEQESIIVYDALVNIRKCAAVLYCLVRDHGKPDDVKNYKDGIYSAVVGLDVLLGPDEMAKNAERHRKIQAECDTYFAKVKAESDVLFGITNKNDGQPRNSRAGRQG